MVTFDRTINVVALLIIIFPKGGPQLVKQVKSKFLIQFSPQQKHLLTLLKLIEHHQFQTIIKLIPTSLQLEHTQPMEQFGKILFVPISNKVVQMWGAGEEAGVELVGLGVDFYFA